MEQLAPIKKMLSAYSTALPLTKVTTSKFKVEDNPNPPQYGFQVSLGEVEVWGDNGSWIKPGVSLRQWLRMTPGEQHEILQAKVPRLLLRMTCSYLFSFFIQGPWDGNI